MKTHHSTRKNKMVHTVASPRSRKFSVTRRAPAFPDEPEWIVYSCDGGSANMVAAFYSQSDAQDYAKWRESQPSDRSQRP